MMELRYETPRAWVDCVLADFDAFLVDHAACERKAAATGLNFVVRYPDRVAMVGPMILFAREELAHFQQVWTWLKKRGLQLGADTKDPYVRSLMGKVRSKGDERLLDRLLVAAVIEARGHERFSRVAEALPVGPLQVFYASIAESEGRHRAFFVEMAGLYFSPSVIEARLSQFLDHEAEAISSQPLTPALH